MQVSALIQQHLLLLMATASFSVKGLGRFLALTALRICGLSLALVSISLPALAQVQLLNVSYDPTRELYSEINSLFAEHYKSRTGVSVTFEQSHGGSSKQAPSETAGLPAVVATLALAWDITAIERAGLTKPGWQQKLPHNATPFT